MKQRLPIRRRRGTIMFEAAIAMLLCGAVTLTVVQLMAFSAHQARSRNQRLVATHEVGNLMEQLMARSWETLTMEATTSIALSKTCLDTLPDAQLDINVAPDGEKAKQVSVTISWHQGSGMPEAPVHLVAWKHARQEASE